MAKRTRRTFTTEQKVNILKTHYLEKKPISELCKEHNLSPKQFYDWQKVLFEGAEAAFEKETKKQIKSLEVTTKHLESRLQHKNNVIAQLMEEHMALKKNNGDL